MDEIPAVPTEDDLEVMCIHLSDGSILLGEVIEEDPDGLFVMNPFILTKIRVPSAVPLASGLAEAVKIILTKYDTFNHTIDGVVRIYKSGIITTYPCDDKIVEFYVEFVDIQSKNMDSSDHELARPTMTDDIQRVLRESTEPPSLDSIRKNVIRLKNGGTEDQE